MAVIIRDDGATTLNLVQEKGKLESITLTPAIARTFLDVLRLFSRGRGFRLIPVDAELATQLAAELAPISTGHQAKPWRLRRRLMLEYTERPEHVHDGKVIVMRSNLRWCSDGFEFPCWNGDVIRSAFIIDAHDREIIAWRVVANAFHQRVRHPRHHA